MAKEAEERIKGRSLIGIQKSFSQPRLADLSNGQILALVLGITKTGFPVPSLEIITEFSHLTLETNIKESVPVGEFLASLASVVSPTKPYPGIHRKSASVRKEVGNRRICDREAMKRSRE